MSWDLYLGNIILYISTILCFFFLFAYPALVREKWRTTPVGRSIYYLIFVMFGVLATVAAANIYGPNYPWRAGLRLAFFSQVPIAVGNLIRLLFAFQLEGYQENYRENYVVNLNKEDSDER